MPPHKPPSDGERNQRAFHGRLDIWMIPQAHAEDAWKQRTVINNLLNARVLSEAVEARLREITHTLAAVERALLEANDDA